MEQLVKIGRFFFSIAMIAFCIHQIVYADLRPVFLATWPSWMPGIFILAYIGNALIITACTMILLGKYARTMALILGSVLLLAFLINHLPFQLATNLHFIAGWSDALKELALSGGAFAVAGSLPEEDTILQARLRPWFVPMEKIVPYSGIMFSITIIIFGTEHFIYPEFVAMLVPVWIPWHLFWTYFGGVALIIFGLAILVKFYPALIATLLGIMLFLWFVMLHIPRGIADPYTGNGNELRSVFEALAFSGIAFVLAGTLKKWNFTKDF